MALLFGPSAALAQTSGPRPLITQSVNPAQLTVLTGNTHPLARAEFDHGAAPASLPMQRMLLILRRSPDQETALRDLLDEQQIKSSPEYHKWLTPEQFGSQFGAADQDIQTITAWLSSNGFRIERVSKGRGVIEFSGTAGQVQQAFHTTIHNYVIQGVQHWSNASDPQIPAALAPAIAGIDSLNNFERKAQHLLVKTTKQTSHATASSAKPELTFVCGTAPNGAPISCNALGPYDFATIYNVLPLWSANPSIDGTGETIAIVARSNINVQDVNTFRSLFGLSPNPPNIILDGPDPGLVPGDETEADLDTEWSGAVAKGATIDVVVSESTETTDGVDLSALYIVDNDLAPIMSESFGTCETNLGAAGNQFYSNLWEQAAAEGISAFVSAGDNGSAGCDFFQGSFPEAAKHGLAVNGLGSTPFNVSVGGTDFNDLFNASTYWNSTNNPTTQQSAKGYIPETTWNDSCTNALFGNPQFGLSTNPETNCNNSQLQNFVFTVGGSGGMSSVYGKPDWQSAPGVPADGKRDLPDVSLFASNGFTGNFYTICEQDVQPCSVSNPLGIGGTSASSPAFAAILALVDQKMGARQGNPNFILYKLASQQTASTCNSSTSPASTCVFNDVTSATIAMPCVTGSPNCNTSVPSDQFGILSGYNAGMGYDLATGLGSVNVTNLVNSWSSVKFSSSTTTLTLNGGSTVNIQHGSPVSVNVSVSPNSPVPTGDVSLIATQANAQGSTTTDFDTLTLANGTASGSTSTLPGGTSYTVTAHYAGDKNYLGGDSNGVTVTVTPEPSKTTLSVVTFDPNTGQITNTNATNVTYGSIYLLRADVTNSSGLDCIQPGSTNPTYGCPTGGVAITDNSTALSSGTFALNSQGVTEDQSIQLTGGSHTLAANYPGDNSYNASATSNPFTVTPAPTQTSIGQLFLPVPQTAIIGQQFSIPVRTQSNSLGAAPGGTYTVFDGTTPIASTSSVSSTAGSSNFKAQIQGNIQTALSAPSGPHSLTVRYGGDANYASSTSPPIQLTALYPITMTATATPNTIIYGSGASVVISVTVDTTNPASNAALKPTGSFSFAENSGNTFINNPVTTNVTQDSNGNWEIQGSISFQPQQSDFITIKYSGDSNYAPSLGGGVFVTVTIPDFSITVPSAPLAVTAGQTGMATITVTPLSNNPSTVALSCSNPFAIGGVSCSVSPQSVTLNNGAPATVTVTVSTTAPSSATSAVTVLARHRGIILPPGRGGWWLLSALFGIAALLVFLAPGKRRRHRAIFGFAVTCVLCFVIGCGGGVSASSGTGGGGGGPATPSPTKTVISTGSTKVQHGGSFALNATITGSQSSLPSGTVTFSAINAITLASSVVNGSAQVTVNSLPVGTYAFTAQYSGDANNLASESGPLSLAITGNALLQVTGSTSTLTHSQNVSLTLQ